MIILGSKCTVNSLAAKFTFAMPTPFRACTVRSTLLAQTTQLISVTSNVFFTIMQNLFSVKLRLYAYILQKNRRRLMIFYFSELATLKLSMARRIAAATGDVVSSIAECVAHRRFDFDASKERRVGFVFPVHFWGLPAIVAEFLEALTLADAGVACIPSPPTARRPDRLAGWPQKRCWIKVWLSMPVVVRMVDTWTLC